MPATDPSTISIVVAGDRSTAQLVVPSAFPRQNLNARICLAMLQEHGVELTGEVSAAVEKLLAQDPGDGHTLTGIVARSTPPTHGVDGDIRWVVDERKQEEEEALDENGDVCHYSRSAFTTVKPGDVVAIIDPPSEGTDGRDVTGRVLPAREGKPPAVQFDETLMRDASGKLIAQHEGVLYRESGKATIREVIEIRENVDFSTGHIEFNGDVIAYGGVRDCFHIDAAGSVEVHGLIEAAHIKCAGDLRALGGFAGREQGTAHIGGNLEARYLDAVRGRTAGDLLMQREIINCDLEVGGDVLASHGAIIGGRLVAAGRIEVGTLGSGANVATELVLGTIPALEPLADQLADLLGKLETARQKLVNEQQRIEKMSARGRLTSVDKERMTEIMYELPPLAQTLERGRGVLEALRERIRDRRTVDLSVNRRMHSGAIVSVDGKQYRVSEQCRGPMRVFLRGQELMYQRGDGPAMSLAEIADVKLRAA